MRKSKCSSGAPCTFYWRMCVSGKHIDEAVDELMGICMDTAGREWPSEAMKADAKVSFQRRLKKAKQGRLESLDEVKSLTRAEHAPLFEIRWNEVLVSTRDLVTGELTSFGISLRLYLYDPDGDTWVVGLWAHEKRFGADDIETKALQDQQIDLALDFWGCHQEAGFGVAELEPKLSTDA